MHLSQDLVDFFDKHLREVANKFRPASEEILKPEQAEEPYRKILEQSSKKISGSVNHAYVNQQIQDHVYCNEDQRDDIRIGSIIMFALDFYSRPKLISKGYTEKQAYDLWSQYMSEGGEDKLFEEIADFDGSPNYEEL